MCRNLFLYKARLVIVGALTLLAAPAWGIVSDDFNACALNEALWTIVDPVGDGTVELQGVGTDNAHLLISVPEGSQHDVWRTGNFAPRVMQPADDTDFEVEVKFDSALTKVYQLQGILVEESLAKYLRIELQSDGTDVRLFVAALLNDNPTVFANAAVPIVGAPMYIRTNRTGDGFTISYSDDGANWTVGTTFTYALAVSSVGVFGGNAAGTSTTFAPAHTVIVGYFVNTADPIANEDQGAPTDTAPPVIYDVAPITSDSALKVTWGTDEPATAFVEYGDTPAVTGGSISHPTLQPQHTVVVESLSPDTTYYFRITAQDAGGRPSSTQVIQVLTQSVGYPEDPLINVWYGLDQTFGHLGIPQTFINILGNTTDFGSTVALSYSLNGGRSSSLALGPRSRRLANNGDFNAEIEYADLVAGANQVVITSQSVTGAKTFKVVDVTYVDGVTWALPTTVDWSAAAAIQDVAQIVDGKWQLQGDTVQVVEPGYDRLIDIGDVTWTDYEVVVPVTVDDLPTGFPNPNYYAAIAVRWPGHSDGTEEQPRPNWTPLGALAGFEWSTAGDQWRMLGSDGNTKAIDPADPMQVGTTYIFKMQVETVPGDSVAYRFKAWPQGSAEPPDWRLEADQPLDTQATGSVLLIAHRANMRFGAVTVTALGGPP